MCRFTCRFPDTCTLKRECCIENFSFCTPFQYLFFLTNKQCSCHSELQIPSNIQARGGKRVVEQTKGVCRFLETPRRELPGFEYFQNSGPLVGAKHCNVWPGIPLKIWPRFCCLGGESELCICGSQLGGQRPHCRGEAEGEG